MKILVTNIYSYENKGDAAIVLALVSEIRRVFPDAELTLLSTDVEHDTERYGAPVSSSLMWILFSSIKDLPLLKRLYESVLRMFGLLFFLVACRLGARPRWLLRGELKDMVNRMNDADMIIACGGGYLCTADSSPRSLLLLLGMCLSFLTGHYLGKPVYLYSQSIGPVRDRLARALVKFSLNRVDLIEVREDISMRYVESLGIRKQFVRTADPAFLLKGRHQPAPIKLEPAPLQVGLTVRKWFSSEERLMGYVGIIARLIDYLVVEYEARITYIPQVIANGFGDDDRLVAQKLQQEVTHKDRFAVLTDDLHPFELIDLCSQMDIFVGTRMHSNIFTLLSDVPVVAIKYEHKTQGIMDGLGVGDMTIDIEKISFEELKEKVDRVIAERDQFSQIIKRNMPSQIRLSRSAMELIKQDFEERA
jgi:colanic acid/amylovoran biosynthesis protein